MLDALHIRFPSSRLGWDVPHLSLSPVPNSVSHPLSKIVPLERRSANGVSVTVDPSDKSDYHSDAPVFRGTVDGTSYHVILKFSRRQSFIDALVDEAGVYAGPLVQMQGSSVPKCHGLFAGETEEGDIAACLVLECWGQVLQKPFRLLPIPMRYVIVPIRQGLRNDSFFKDTRYFTNWYNSINKESSTAILLNGTSWRRTVISGS